MISRASRMLTEVFSENTDISQLFSTVLYNLVFGELIQAKRDMIDSQENKLSADSAFDHERYFNSYVSKTYYKTASMISLGCRGIGVLMNFDIES